MINKKVTGGFTLIELTVVLFIVSLLLAGLLLPLRQGIETERRAETLTRLKSIEESLYGFAIANGRLPCPDCRVAAGNCPGAGNTINDGLEDLVGNNCAADPNPGAGTPNDVLEGNLPWVTLGTNQFDNWESWFTYSVVDFAADITGNGTPGLNDTNCVVTTENLATIDTCAVGNYTVQNVSAACPSPPAVLPPAVIAQNVMAVVVSHGANVTRTAVPAVGLIDAPPLCSELENLDQDGVFVSSSFINPGPPGATAVTAPSPLGIDDQIIWISPNILKSKLIQSGRLP
ncbi:MAG: prepilin-type N-terminal cleavage/methylation domain-containing protein [Gammaproteobacteria bacterium]|nr:prepilin-type N-terminal cleavage/methylation domain-containing protein [Gammaproteobacteria bacterium]